MRHEKTATELPLTLIYEGEIEHFIYFKYEYFKFMF